MTGLLCLLADGAHAGASVRFHPADTAAAPLASLWSASENAGRWLRQRHGPGAAVGIVLQPDAGSLAALVGGWRAGLTMVSLPHPSRRTPLTEYRSQIAELCRLADVERLLVTADQVGSLERVVTEVDAVDRSSAGGPPVSLDGDGRFVQCSSGTTGAPKGIRLSLDALGANIAAILDRLGLAEPFVSCSWLPLSHDMGLVGMCLAVWSGFGPRWGGGGEMVLMPPELFVRRPSIWPTACSAFGASVTAAPTTAYDLVARRLSPDADLALERLDVCIVGAEPVRAEVLGRFADAAGPLGLRDGALCPAYGMAEASLAVAMSEPGQGWSTHRPGPSAAEVVGVGRALADTEVEVLDAAGRPRSAGTDVPADVGELAVRSPSLFDGYLGAPLRPPGSHHPTGDLGAVVDGQVLVTGRTDDLLFVAGRNIHATELEAALGGVAGIRRDRCAVLPDEDRYIVVAERQAGRRVRDQLPDICRQVRATVARRAGAGPTAVLMAAPGSLPLTPSGKLRRRQVEQMLQLGDLPLDHTARFRTSDGALAGTNDDQSAGGQPW